MSPHFRAAAPQQGPARKFNYRDRPSKGAFQGHSGGGPSGGRGQGGHAGRGSFGGGRGGFHGGMGGRSGGRGGGFSRHIDTAKFINKAVVTETQAVFKPEHAFTDFNIDARLKANIVARKYLLPTPIQDKAIPHVLLGTDVVGIANTGTGKTAAFLIPLINKILIQPRTKVLIVVPTRELADQITDEFRSLTPGLNMQAVCAVGGASIVNQIRQLSRQPQILVGTPGRLRDLIDRSKVNLAEYSTVVLDEADRMLDMGFINDIRFMLAKMPADRHTLFFSATISNEIQNLIKQFLRNPVNICVKTGDTPKAIDQDVVKVPVGKNKFDMLCELLRQPAFNKVLVFGKTKHGVQRLALQLSALGFKAESIHGNKTQPQRQKALNLFKEHHMNILVATDVAARGLDIASVSHVINYDLPATYEDYVHRIGRTGRGGLKGMALTFV